MLRSAAERRQRSDGAPAAIGEPLSDTFKLASYVESRRLAAALLLSVEHERAGRRRSSSEITEAGQADPSRVARRANDRVDGDPGRGAAGSCSVPSWAAPRTSSPWRESRSPSTGGGWPGSTRSRPVSTAGLIWPCGWRRPASAGACIRPRSASGWKSRSGHRSGWANRALVTRQAIAALAPARGQVPARPNVDELGGVGDSAQVGRKGRGLLAAGPAWSGASDNRVPILSAGLRSEMVIGPSKP